MPPENVIEQFANTYKEWHYLVAGLSVGGLLGYILSDIINHVFRKIHPKK